MVKLKPAWTNDWKLGYLNNMLVLAKHVLPFLSFNAPVSDSNNRW